MKLGRPRKRVVRDKAYSRARRIMGGSDGVDVAHDLLLWFVIAAGPMSLLTDLHKATVMSELRDQTPIRLEVMPLEHRGTLDWIDRHIDNAIQDGELWDT